MSVSSGLLRRLWSTPDIKAAPQLTLKFSLLASLSWRLRGWFIWFQLWDYKMSITVPKAPTAAPLRLVLLQQLAGYDQSLDLTGALVDLGDASVAVVPLGGHVGHITHPAQNLDGLIWSKIRDIFKSPLEGFFCILYISFVAGFLTWWEQYVAASDAASLAMAASWTQNITLMNVTLGKKKSNSISNQIRGDCTLVKGFFASRRSEAFQVSSRALSTATAMSASLN